jgi:hypothetical protein
MYMLIQIGISVLFSIVTGVVIAVIVLFGSTKRLAGLVRGLDDIDIYSIMRLTFNQFEISVISANRMEFTTVTNTYPI